MITCRVHPEIKLEQTGVDRWFCVFFFRYCLMRSLRQIQMTLDFVEDLGLKLKWHGRTKDEGAHYCNECEVRMVLKPMSFVINELINQ